MKSRNQWSAKQLSINGILLALAVITLFAATVAPTNRLSLYALSSFFVSIIIVEYGVRNGWVFYLASCLTAFILIPDKLELIPYMVFFGLYGIVKYHIEKLRKLFFEYILKFAYFNLCAGIASFFIKQFFPQIAELTLPWWLIIAAAEVVFILYDYVYTLFVQYYGSRLKKILKM